MCLLYLSTHKPSVLRENTMSLACVKGAQVTIGQGVGAKEKELEKPGSFFYFFWLRYFKKESLVAQDSLIIAI